MLEPEEGPGTARPCECRAQELTPRLLAAAGIPPRYRGCSLANFQVEDPDRAKRDQLFQALEVSRGYVEAFVAEGGGFTEQGLLYAGPPGVGKTHLAVGVLAELIRRYRVHGLFVDFTSLIHRIHATFESGSPTSKGEVLEPVTGAEVLVLDDLGAQKPSEWVNELLYAIINERYAQRRPTLFTTNLRLERASGAADPALDRSARYQPESLSWRIPASLMSRLFEMARPVTIEADDFRRVVKATGAGRGFVSG